MPSDDIHAIQVGDTWEIRAPWGMLTVYDGEVYGITGLMLPNVSMSVDMATDLGLQLLLAAGKAKGE